MKVEQVRRSLRFFAVAIVLALGGCGGGSDGDNDDDGGNGGANAFAPTGYVVFRAGEQASLSGAGAVSDRSANEVTLSLGADGKTTLAVTNPNSFSMSASNTNYHVVNRRDGAVLMLCDPLSIGGEPGTTRARYVAIATNAATAETQATPVTSAVELAGKAFYVIGACSYLDDLQNVQGVDDAPNGFSLEYRFDANGNLRGSNGWVVDATTFSGFLNGAFFVDPSGRKVWFSAYKFTVNGEQKIYFATRLEPANGDGGFIGLWTDEPDSDLVGCSLGCSKPADATSVTNPASVAGVYFAQYAFGSEASLVWVNSAGRYAYGLATETSNSQFFAGLETGTLSFDATGNISATVVHDSNGTGEAIQWSANASQVVSTAVADPTRHFILERVERDASNPLIGAWALATCGGQPINSTDPTQSFVAVYLKSGHYMIMDTFGTANNASPTPGIEYGEFVQDVVVQRFQHATNSLDTNLAAGVWNTLQDAPNGSVRSYTMSPDGNTMSVTATGDGCGTATLVRIN